MNLYNLWIEPKVCIHTLHDNTWFTCKTECLGMKSTKHEYVPIL